MATYSDSMTLKVPNGGTDEISIEVKELSYNANTNVATVRITLGFYVGIRYDESSGGDVFAQVDGYDGTDLSCSWHIGRTNGVWDRYTWHYETYDKTMSCTPDGKAMLSVSYWGWRRYSSNVYVPEDKTVWDGSLITLNTHNRVSTLSLSSTSVPLDGTTFINMSITRQSSAMTKHDLIITYPTVTSEYKTETVPLQNVYSYSYCPPKSGNLNLLEFLPANGKTIQGYVILRSYYLPNPGGMSPTYADSSPQYFTVTAQDSDIAPTLTLNAIDWIADNNVTSGLVGNLNNYILNVSKCKLTGTAETKYGATINSFGLFTNEDKTIGITDTGTQPNYEFSLNQLAPSSNFSASNTMKVKITDSRGISGSITVPLSFIPYIRKSLNDNNNIARINPTSDEIKITSLTGKWWNGNFLGHTNNDLVISWDYKELNASSYTTGGTIDTLHYSSGTPSGTYTTYDNTTQTFTISNYTFTKNSSTHLFNYQKAYMIRLTVSDAVTAYPANPLYITISAGIANFAIHEDTILINGKTIWDILYPVHSIYMTDDSTFNPNTYFTGTTWSQVTGYYLYAGSTPGTTLYTGGGTQSTTLTAAQCGVPAHSHGASSGDTTPTGTITNVLMDDYNNKQTGTGVFSTEGISGNQRSWSGTGGSALKVIKFSAKHSHTVTVNNNTAADASSGHTHPIATYTICVWKRTA